MTTKVSNILIVESTASHFEWIYTQNIFLADSNLKLDVAVDRRFASRLNFLSDNQINIFNFDNSKPWQYFSELIRLRKLSIKNNYSLIIFNTAHNNFVRDLLLILPSKIPKIGLLHRAQNLLRSKTQKFITQKINGYLTLADYQEFHVRKLIDLPVQTIYNTQLINQRVPDNSVKSESIFKIVIPGAVENYRRDYIGLLNNLHKASLSDNIQIILLGKLDIYHSEGLKISELIRCNSKYNQIIYYTDFVPDEIFNEVMYSANLLLPLINPDMNNFENYFKYQISGTFNLSYAYKIPMLIHEEFRIYPEFEELSYFYNSDSMFLRLRELSENSELIIEAKQKIIRNNKYTFQYQKNRYFDFISSFIEK